MDVHAVAVQAGSWCGAAVVPESSSSHPWDREQQERSGHREKGQIPLLPATTSGFSPRWEQLPSAQTSPELPVPDVHSPEESCSGDVMDRVYRKMFLFLSFSLRAGLFQKGVISHSLCPLCSGLDLGQSQQHPFVQAQPWGSKEQPQHLCRRLHWSVPSHVPPCHPCGNRPVGLRGGSGC